jgi:hypothetical protein
VQAVSESIRHKPINRAACPAAFFATLVTGDEVRLFFFTAVAPLVNAIGNEFIAEIFSRMLPRFSPARGRMNARIQPLLQTAGQLEE